MIRSLLGKLLLSHIVVILIVTLCSGLLLSHLVSNYLIEVKRTELIRQGMATVRFLNEAVVGRRNLALFLDNLGELSGTTMWIMDNDDQIIGGQPPQRWHHRGSGGMHGNNMRRHADGAPPEPPPDMSPPPGEDVKSWVYQNRNDDDPSIVVSMPFPDAANTFLLLHTPITGIAKTSAAIQELLLYSLLGSVLLAGIFAFYLSRSLTKPITNIGKAAAKFAAGDYDSRATAVGQDEIGRLGKTFNEMAAVLTRIEKNRREFFSDVTHELKTPLASMQALTESMLDGIVTDEKQRERYLSTILSEITHMNHLISDLLNLAQLESGQHQFNCESVDLEEFVQALEQKYAPLLEEKGQSIVFSVAPELKTLRADRLRLDQILANLVSNAIRHSKENSEIRIEFALRSGSAEIAVIDHGEGIPEAELANLWERFYRVDKSRVRSKGGTGLGLAITKKLVEGMGGTIGVASTPEKETVFRFTLPQS